MSTEYSPRRSRRNDRRRRSGSSGRAKMGDVKPAKKKSLIQKILGVFGVGKKSTQKKKTDAPKAKKPAPAASPRPSRKPENIEVTTARVYVGNLPYETTESDLLELFNGAGLVQNTEIITNKHTQRSKGFGFVQFQTIDEAKRAVEELHDKEYMGRKLVVSGAKADDRRSS